MKGGTSLVVRIIVMVCMTAVIICAAVTILGSVMIHVISADAAKEEERNAAHTLYEYYDRSYAGDYAYNDSTGVLKKGGSELSVQDFQDNIELIGCSEDMDFTIFWGDTRILTSVKNSSGGYATGTKASERAVSNVFNTGLEYSFSDVTVNDTSYVGCYIPIINSDKRVVGMVFAGKPLDAANRTSRKMTQIFILVCGGVLIFSLIISFIYSRKMVRALGDIKGYMADIAECSFKYEMDGSTLERSDEVGDIARNALKLQGRLRDLIERDPLTHLLNRRSCRRMIDEIIKSGGSYCVAMGDIDFFKKINDT